MMKNWLIEDEDPTAVRLLRMAGMRAEAPADRGTRVREAVHLQWRSEIRRRAIRRRVLYTTGVLVAAATLVLAVRVQTIREPGGSVSLWSLVSGYRSPGSNVELPEAVGTFERVDGDVRVLPRARGEGTGLPGLLAGEKLRAGEWVETAAHARAAIRLDDDTSLRVDGNSRVRLISPTVIELTAGAVYLDTGRDSTGLEVRTPFGTARDIGTQFEIRLGEASLRLRVRTGIVQLRRGNQSIPAAPGTELTMADAGTVSRTVSAHGPEWDWVLGLVPPFEIDGRPLAVFLAHLSREHGWTLRYADAALEREASGIILHGSIRGLQAPEALAVALATSGLAHRLGNGELLVYKN